MRTYDIDFYLFTFNHLVALGNTFSSLCQNKIDPAPITQQLFTCSKSTIGTLKKGKKYV